MGTQFTPALVSLPNFVAAVVAHSGDHPALQRAVWDPKVRTARPKKAPTRRLRNLPLEAAVQYGLLEAGTYVATPLAHELSKLSDPDLYDAFARHVLLRCGGLRVLDGVRQMQADGLKVTGDSLARWLSSQGFLVVEHNTAINTLRLWLSMAGIFPEGRGNAWRIDEARTERLLRLSQSQILALAGLTPAQAAFVEGLCVTNQEGWIRASQIRDWAETFRGVRLGRGSLPKEVLDALQSIGVIEYKTKGTGGGKTSVLRTTELFRREVLEPFVQHAIKDLDAAVSGYYQRKPADIFAGLESSNVHEKGMALEAFAIYLMRLMGLRFVGWRKREAVEVDALMEGVLGPVATRWQVQCKNTPGSTVRVEDIAKEVGLLPVSRATHILFMANSTFSADAVRFAADVMKNAPVGLFLMDRADLQKLKTDPGEIGPTLRAKSGAMLGLGRPAIFGG